MGLKHFEKNNKDVVYIFMGMAAVAVFFVIFSRPYYKRHQFEKNGYRLINRPDY